MGHELEDSAAIETVKRDMMRRGRRNKICLSIL